MTYPAKTCNHVLESLVVTAGEQVRLARKARGLSQKALADAVGVNETTVWRLENDKHKDSTTLETVQSYLGIGPYADMDARRPDEVDYSRLTNAELAALISTSAAVLSQRLASEAKRTRPSSGIHVPTYDGSLYGSLEDAQAAERVNPREDVG